MKATKELSTKSRMTIYAKIVVGLTLVFALFGLVTAFLTVPTQEHREVARELGQMSNKAWSSPDPETILNSKQYTTLNKSPEGKYTAAASFIDIAANLVLTITLVGLVYNYLRKNHIARRNKALGATVLLVTFSSLLSLALAWYPRTLLFGDEFGLFFSESSGFGSLIPAIVGVISTVLVVLLVHFVIASIFERRYNKKHSFVVE